MQHIWKKIMAVTVTTAMTVTQIIPAGWAQEQTGDQTRMGNPAQTLEAAEQKDSEEASLREAAQIEMQTMADFLEGNSALSPFSEETPSSREKDSLALKNYYAKLSEFDAIKSGIAINKKIRLDEAVALKNLQDQLKAVLEGIIVDGEEPSEEAVNEFNRRVEDLDKILATGTVLFNVNGVKVEMNGPEAMKLINQEYQRLGLVAGGSDYDRLPGIEKSDMDGHETFAKYLDARQIGVKTQISVFKGLSPFGTLTFAAALVKKYGMKVIGADADGDGYREIDAKIFSRMVNGTQQAYEEAEAKIKGITAQHPIQIPGQIDTLEALEKIMTQLDAYRKDLDTTLAIADAMTSEKVFKDLIRYEIQVLIDGALSAHLQSITQTLEKQKSPVDTFVEKSGFQFPAEGTVSFEELLTLAQSLNSFNTSLKAQVDGLLAKFDDSSVKRSVQYALQNESYRGLAELLERLTTGIGTRETEINKIINEAGISLPGGDSVEFETLLSINDKTKALRASLTEKIKAFFTALDALEIDQSIKYGVRSKVTGRVNGEYVYVNNQHTRIPGLYETLYNQIQAQFNNRRIIFNVEGLGPVSMLAHDLNLLTNQLPRDRASLLRFPGIAEALSEEDLKNLESGANALGSSIIVDGQMWPQSDSYLSQFAVRIQLTALMINANKEKVVQSGAVNLDLMRQAYLMNSYLEAMFQSSRKIIEAGGSKIRNLVPASQPLSAENYLKIHQIIRDTNLTVVNVMKLGLDGVIYDARQLITGMLQDSFNKMLSEADAIFARGKIVVDIEGKKVLVDANQAHKSLKTALSRVAVIWDGQGEYSKAQYDRLNGISTELVKSRRTSYELNFYRQVSFDHRDPNFPQDLDQQMDRMEILYGLIPAILKVHGKSVLNEQENFDPELLVKALLSKINVPAGEGQTIREALNNIILTVVDDTEARLRSLDFSKWEDRMKGEALLPEAILAIEAKARSLAIDLTPNEKQILTSWANQYNYYWNQGGSVDARNVYDLWSILNQMKQTKVATITLPDGKIFRADLDALRSIPGFPYSSQYDKDLFIGLTASDFKGTENVQQYIGIQIGGENRGLDIFYPSNAYSLDQYKLAVNVITRLYQTRDSLPAIYKDRVFKKNEDGSISLNIEIVRRLLKGVDLMHERVKGELTNWIQKKNVEIEALQTDPMTIESINAIYSAIETFRGELLGHLNQLTQKHEIYDVYALENSLNKDYQEITKGMINYIRGNKLVVVVNNVQYAVPVKEITEKMMAALNKKYPGEDIAAHHFASFFGVPVSLIRKLDMLERFLGNQIVALPRTSSGEIVEVLSKLSEIGMMQLMVQVIHRNSDVVIGAGGTIDADALVASINNPDRALAEAKKTASSLFDEVRSNIAGAERPITLETVLKLSSLFDDAKLRIVTELNDRVSGFNDAMFAELQAHIDITYQEVRNERMKLIMEGPVVVTTRDGIVFKINLVELTPKAAAKILELLAQFPEKKQPEEIMFYRAFAPQMMLSVDSVETVQLSRKADSMVMPSPPIRIWYPQPSYFDPAASPSEFGFEVLLLKLAAHYGRHAADDSGVFSPGNFLIQLGLSDLDRAKKDFIFLRDGAIKRLRELVPENAAKVIKLGTIDTIHGVLDEARAAIVKSFNQAVSAADNYTESGAIHTAANEAWQAVISEYETLVLPRPFVMEVNGGKVIIDGKVLVGLIREAFKEGETGVIDSYLQGGEDESAWWNYKSIPWQRYYPMGGGSGKSDDSSENAASQIYPFTFGDLNRLPGIRGSQLAGIETAAKDGVILTKVEAKELLKGYLNMRVFSAGSGVQTIGAMADSMSMSKSMSVKASGSADSMMVDYGIKTIPDPSWKPSTYLNASARDLLYRVIPAMVRDFAKRIVIDGTIDAEKFSELLRDTGIVRDREKKQVLEGLASQISAFSGALTSGVEKLKAFGGITGIVERGTDGGYYLVVREPRLHAFILKYTDSKTGLLTADAAGDKDLAFVMEASKLSKEELFAKRAVDIRRDSPSLRYFLGHDIYYYDYGVPVVRELDSNGIIAPIPGPRVYWGSYEGKMVHFQDAEVSYNLNDTGVVEGRINTFVKFNGIQYALEALKLMSTSEEARKAQKLREAYLDRFIRGAAEREEQMVKDALASQANALQQALNSGFPELGGVALAGTLQRDDKGFYLSVPEPMLLRYLQDNLSVDTGRMKVEAITEEFLQLTGIDRKILIAEPVKELIKRLPSIRYDIKSLMVEDTLPLDDIREKFAAEEEISLEDDMRMTFDGGARSAVEMEQLSRMWPDLASLVGRSVYIKGNLSYHLSVKGRLEGSLLFWGGIQELRHAKSVNHTLMHSDEAHKAQELRRQYAEHFLKGNVGTEEEAAVEMAKELLLNTLALRVDGKGRELIKRQIQVVSVQKIPQYDVCADLQPGTACRPAKAGYQGIISLFGNNYETVYGALTDLSRVTVHAVNRLLSEGKKLESIKVESAGVTVRDGEILFLGRGTGPNVLINMPTDGVEKLSPEAMVDEDVKVSEEAQSDDILRTTMYYPLPIPLTYRVVLTVDEERFELTLDASGAVLSLRQHDAAGRIVLEQDADGAIIRYRYDDKSATPSALEITYGDRTVFVALHSGKGITGNAAGAVKAAVKDLILQNELPLDESKIKITLAKYEEGMGLCTHSMPPHCSKSASLELHTSKYAFGYEVQMTGGFSFDKFSAKLVSKNLINNPVNDLPKEALIALAKQLNVSVESIFDITSETRNFITCLGTGCATWSRYVSFSAKSKDGQSQHYAGVVTGGWFGHMKTLNIPEMSGIIQAGALMRADTDQPLKTKRPFIQPVLRLPSVQIIAVDPSLDGRAVEAIAEEAGVSIPQLDQVILGALQKINCITTPCAEWIAELKVTVFDKDNSLKTFVGEIQKFGGEPAEMRYKIYLRLEGEDPVTTYPTPEEEELLRSLSLLQYFQSDTDKEGTHEYQLRAEGEGVVKFTVEYNPCRGIPMCKAKQWEREFTVHVLRGSEHRPFGISPYLVNINMMGESTEAKISTGYMLRLFNLPQHARITAVNEIPAEIKMEEFIPAEKMDKQIVRQLEAMGGGNLKLLGMRIKDMRPVDGNRVIEYEFKGSNAGEVFIRMERGTNENVIKQDENGTIYEEMKTDLFGAIIDVQNINWIREPDAVIIEADNMPVVRQTLGVGQKLVIRIVQELGGRRPQDVIALFRPWVIAPAVTAEHHFAMLLALENEASLNDIRILEAKIVASSASPCAVGGRCAFYERYEISYANGPKDVIHKAIGTVNTEIYEGVRTVRYAIETFPAAEVLNATEQLFWNAGFSDAIAEILKVKAGALVEFTITAENLKKGNEQIICHGPGCAAPYTIAVKLSDGTMYSAVVSFSWDQVLSVQVSDLQGNVIGSVRRGDGKPEIKYPSERELALFANLELIKFVSSNKAENGTRSYDFEALKAGEVRFQIATDPCKFIGPMCMAPTSLHQLILKVLPNAPWGAQITLYAIHIDVNGEEREYKIHTGIHAILDNLSNFQEITDVAEFPAKADPVLFVSVADMDQAEASHIQASVGTSLILKGIQIEDLKDGRQNVTYVFEAAARGEAQVSLSRGSLIREMYVDANGLITERMKAESAGYEITVNPELVYFADPGPLVLKAGDGPVMVHEVNPGRAVHILFVRNHPKPAPNQITALEFPWQFGVLKSVEEQLAFKLAGAHGVRLGDIKLLKVKKTMQMAAGCAQGAVCPSTVMYAIRYLIGADKAIYRAQAEVKDENVSGIVYISRKIETGLRIQGLNAAEQGIWTDVHADLAKGVLNSTAVIADVKITEAALAAFKGAVMCMGPRCAATAEVIITLMNGEELTAQVSKSWDNYYTLVIFDEDGKKLGESTRDTNPKKIEITKAPLPPVTLSNFDRTSLTVLPEHFLLDASAKGTTSGSSFVSARRDTAAGERVFATAIHSSSASVALHMFGDQAAALNEDGQLVLALKAQKAGRVKLVARDASGQEKVFDLDLAKGYKNFTINLHSDTAGAALNVSAIVALSFVLTKNDSGEKNEISFFAPGIKAKTVEFVGRPTESGLFKAALVNAVNNLKMNLVENDANGAQVKLPVIKEDLKISVTKESQYARIVPAVGAEKRNNIEPTQLNLDLRHSSKAAYEVQVAAKEGRNFGLDSSHFAIDLQLTADLAGQSRRDVVPLTLKFTDASNRTAEFTINITEEITRFDFDLKLKNPNFDYTAIKSVSFKGDRKENPTDLRYGFRLWLKEQLGLA